METYFENIPPTAEQADALERMMRFINHPKQKIFLLKGYAGTGKTTLVNAFCRYLEELKIPLKLAAPTGRASLILRHKTTYNAVTIHKQIYSYDGVLDTKEGNSFFMKFNLRENEDSEHSVYLIDEASMISNQLSEDEFFKFGSGILIADLMEYALNGLEKTKIIFIGDVAQLPPVGLSISPALDASYHLGLNYTSDEVPEVMLRTVLRQEESSGIIKNATAIRQAIEAEKFNAFELATGYPDVRVMDTHEVADFYVQTIRDPHHGMVIAHSNKAAQQYNNAIRAKRLGGTDKPLTAGEWLLVVRNNNNNNAEFFNGELVKVIEVGPIIRDEVIRFRGHKGELATIGLTFRAIEVEHTLLNGTQERVQILLLEDMLWSDGGKLNPLKQRALYIDFKMRVAEQGIKPGHPQFSIMLKADKYFNALQAKFGYAITCHKAQGGEWEHVFVDFSYLSSKRDPVFFRWAYTAITRATSKLYCINLEKVLHGVVFQWMAIETMPKVPAKMYYAHKTKEDAFAFVKQRQQRIEDQAQQNELKVSITPAQYMLKAVFTQDTDVVQYNLHYKKEGFSKDELVSSASQPLKTLVDAILGVSLVTEDIPFVSRFVAEEQMYERIKAVLKEEEVLLSNIVQTKWSTQYYIKTNADCAMVEVFFNGDNALTKATPSSSDGYNDEQLQRVITALRYG